jgi:solute carrier family 12 sodium/potassium/chloride transporter 2
VKPTSSDLKSPATQKDTVLTSGLGTFGGVFTPSILTILGVIMYLRFGWVVGNVGLLGTLVIVTLSTTITLLTALSISAIATSQRVGTGGAYFMISRSLGIEAGGAVGLPLYFALLLSVALYTVGFAESVVRVFPMLNETTVGIVTVLVVSIIALTSAQAAIRAQYVIMAAIALSLVSLLLGQPLEPTTIELTGAPPRLSEGFWVVFAVFFPAVTGIMAGVNMSGDLRDPARAIPRGTLAAVATGYLVYMTLPIILALRADATTLIEDPLIMRRMALWGDAILLGVWGATLSSAVGSILTAPRVLQALANDGVLPSPLRWLGRGSGPQREPRFAIVVTAFMALVAVYFGNLNLIAPVLTMFFLTTYGVLNLAAGVERFLGSASYRPSFKVPWGLSLLGAVGCVAVMFLINALATVVAMAVVVTIFSWLKQRELRVTWGDVRQGIWMVLARTALLRISTTSEPKSWRPHLLVLSGAPTQRWQLVELAAALTHRRAIMTLATVLTSQSMPPGRQMRLERTVQAYLARHNVQALLRIVKADDPFTGAERLVDAYGIGPLVPNTILLGASENPASRERYCQMLRHFYEARRNIAILNYVPEREFGARRRIDLWWGGLRNNGGLMMTLAYLLQTSGAWQNASVHVKMVVTDEGAVEMTRSNLSGIVKEFRTKVVPEVIPARERPFNVILHEASHDADLVMLGMKEPNDDYTAYYERLQTLAVSLPSTLFLLAGEEIAFSEILIKDRT